MPAPASISTGAPALLNRAGALGLACGVLGAAACGLAFGLDRAQFLSAYLPAYLFWLGISLGGLSVTMIHHLTGGEWGLVVRRPLESAMSALPLMAVLFIPLFFGVSELYEWARPDLVSGDARLLAKQRYLNVHDFEIRAIVYFAIWITLALLLGRWSVPRPSETSHIARENWMRRVSAPGLILYAFSLTFASIDWSMSLEPHWYSSIYPIIYMGGQAVAGLACGVLTAAWFEKMDALPAHPASRWHDLGNLLLAFVMFWAYVSYMQFLIIWAADLPEEVVWYIRRLHGGWQYVGISLIALHFGVPFLMLLSRDLKRSPRGLIPIVSLLLVMRLVDLVWLTQPPFSPGRLTWHWSQPAAWFAVGGFWMAWYAWNLRGRLAIPVELPGAEELPP